MYSKRIIFTTLVMALCFMSVAAVAQSNQGFIYGTVETESGKEYTGFLRWGTQEAFWDDLFHSSKVDLDWIDYLDDDERDEARVRRDKSFRLFGKRYSVNSSYSSGRMFIARFGDIERIRPDGDGEATVYMKSGESYDVSGGADDVTSNIMVTDDALGDIELHWDRIREIRFKQAPKNADPGVWRLYGTVKTDQGDFKGYIQWDKQECLNIDELDGDTDDGDISIKMGSIASIERLSSRRSHVVLKDGREMKLHGSNDVNSENRGIMIEDERYGRVTVMWDAFEKLTFEKTPGSGRAYDDYKAQKELRGTVTDERGREMSGRLVFDLDEEAKWEMLNGEWEDIKFDIPFANVRMIEIVGRNESRVTLTSGETIELQEGTDVSRRNAGLLIFDNDRDDPVYIAWRDIEKITFDK